MKPHRRPWGFSLTLSAILCVPSWATVRTVYPDGSGMYPTIQSAINRSVDGDIVDLADGTFSGNGNRDIRFLGKAIMVRSQNGPARCVVNSGGSPTDEHAGFRFQTGEGPGAVLRGVTITGGCFFGGGISITSASPTIMECVVTTNTAGGYHTGGAGAGIGCQGGGSPRFVDCVISNNSVGGSDYSGAGGGVYLDGQPSFEHCTFEENSAGGFRATGGAVYCVAGSSPSFTLCTFRDNGAFSGSAVYLQRGQPMLVDCLFDGNTANVNNWGLGAGVACIGSNARIEHCVFTNNLAAGAGAASIARVPPWCWSRAPSRTIEGPDARQPFVLRVPP
jgi:predicted outer membrane repeat protein